MGTGGADGQARSLSRIATAVRDLQPGYFALVMATGIISTGTFLLGPSWLSHALLVAASAGFVVLSTALLVRLAIFRSSVAAAGFVEGFCFALWAFGTWWIPLLIVLGLWRHIRRRWPAGYEPTLWSVVFPLGMYSVATLSFGEVAVSDSWRRSAGSCSGWPSPPGLQRPSRSSPGSPAGRANPPWERQRLQ